MDFHSHQVYGGFSHCWGGGLIIFAVQLFEAEFQALWKCGLCLNSPLQQRLEGAHQAHVFLFPS